MLKSWQDVSTNYDRLSQAMLRSKRLVRTMQEPEFGLQYAGDSQTDSQLNDLLQLVLEKQAAVENFKRRNAVFQFSKRYFPTIVRQITFNVHNDKDLMPGQKTSLLGEVDRLARELAYGLAGQLDTRTSIARRIERLQHDRHLLNDALNDQVQLAIAYTRIIVGQHNRIMALTRDVESMRTGENISSLHGFYAERHYQSVQRAGTYRFYLYMVSIGLVIYLALILWRLSRISRELQTTLEDVQVLARFPEENRNVVMRATADGCLVYANDAARPVISQWGIVPGEMLPTRWREQVQQCLMNELVSERVVMCNDSVIKLQLSPIPSAGYVNFYGNDITEQRHAQEQLAREKELAQVTLHSIGDGVITTDAELTIQYINPVAEQMTGWDAAQALDRPLHEVFVIAPEGNAPESGWVNPVEHCLRSGETVSLTEPCILTNIDGDKISVEETAAPIRDRHGGVIGSVVIFHDVSEERQLQNQLAHQAAHDGLTGLVNRSEFRRRMNQALGSVDAAGHTHALLYLDLDQFKIVNDTCGHLAGDELLRQLSLLLQQNIRDADTLARLGGDEFAVLLIDCSVMQARQVAEGLLDTVNSFRFVWEENSFDVGASIGLVPIDAASLGEASLMSAADVACYAAKDHGRNRIHEYQSGDSDLAMRHGEMQWISRITQALEEDRLILYGQEVRRVSPRGGQQERRYELLVRLRDRDGNIVPPGAFIPAAERYNMMPTIDRWVVRKAFSFYRAVARSGRPVQDLCFAINLSGSSLGDEYLLSYVQQGLEEFGVPPGAICFEITETAAITNLTTAVRFMQELKQTGCGFALDDFGSGLSSFGYLKNLPVDYLKIDGSFVKDMVDDPIDHAMVEAINQIGHVMGIQTIAEFVENEEILECLRAVGVDYVQGYGVHCPEPLADILELAEDLPEPGVNARAG